MIPCACGCGELMKPLDNQDRPRMFKPHHYSRVQTKEHRQKNSIAKLNENNPFWKGNDVSMRGLHRYMYNRIPKPNKCKTCKSKPAYDLANITGIYNREIKNWQWMCRSCHQLFDFKHGMRKAHRK